MTLSKNIYKSAYFILFCATCDTIESIEKILSHSILPTATAKQLQEEIQILKQMQFKTEEFILSTPKVTDLS